MWTGAGFRRKLNNSKARRIQFCLQGRLELLCKECWSYLVRFFFHQFFSCASLWDERNNENLICFIVHFHVRFFVRFFRWTSTLRGHHPFSSVSCACFATVIERRVQWGNMAGGCEVEDSCLVFGCLMRLIRPWKLHICEADVWGTKYSAGPAHRMQRLDYVDRNPSELQAFFVVVAHMNG